MNRIGAWRLRRSVALVYIGLMFPAMHAAIPWALSRLGTRHGWLNGTASAWNIAGCLPLAAGFACVVWCVRLHFAAAPEGWKFEKAPHYLLVNGPYTYSRNPIYVSDFVLWLGWAIFHGSLVVLAGALALVLTVGGLVVKCEERTLEDRFGSSYREYARTVPRWL